MADKIRTRQQFEPIIHELNSELKKKYDDFVGITFFGSRCRGDFSEESDFDIVIMFSKKGSATPAACTAWPFPHVKDVFSNLCFF